MDNTPFAKETYRKYTRFSDDMRILEMGIRLPFFFVTIKVHELEHIYVSQNAIIMDNLVQLKRQMQVLEEECGMYRSMVSNLRVVLVTALYLQLPI